MKHTKAEIPIRAILQAILQDTVVIIELYYDFMT
jgi:hypothetical protein